jgi:chromosome segregation ATPase
MIKLDIDDEAFRRKLEADKAAIAAELAARKQELDANAAREPGLSAAIDTTGAAALAAKNARDKNQAKLDQMKQDLQTAQDTAKKDEAVLATPHHFGDRADTFIKKQAQENLDHMQAQIGQLTNAINQARKKQEPLEEAAALAKEQFERAKADYDAAAKLEQDAEHTIFDLAAKLAGANAKAKALEESHSDLTRVKQTEAAIDAANKRVQAGTATNKDKGELEVAESQLPFEQLNKMVGQHLREAQDRRRQGAESAEDWQDLLGQIMGLLDQLVMHPGIQNASAMQQQLNNLESRLANSR